MKHGISSIRDLLGTKIARALGFMLLISVAAIGGYHCRTRTSGTMASPVGDLPDRDYYTPPQTFSEVQNAKNALEGLSMQLATEVSVKRWRDLKRPIVGGTAAGPNRPTLKYAIADLERALLEFEGTGQEYYVAHDLLNALSNAKLYDRWVAVYLKALCFVETFLNSWRVVASKPP